MLLKIYVYIILNFNLETLKNLKLIKTILEIYFLRLKRKQEITPVMCFIFKIEFNQV